MHYHLEVGTCSHGVFEDKRRVFVACLLEKPHPYRMAILLSQGEGTNQLHTRVDKIMVCDKIASLDFMLYIATLHLSLWRYRIWVDEISCELCIVCTYFLLT